MYYLSQICNEYIIILQPRDVIGTLYSTQKRKRDKKNKKNKNFGSPIMIQAVHNHSMPKNLFTLWYGVLKNMQTQKAYFFIRILDKNLLG